MKRLKWIMITSTVIALLTIGCALKRANVSALAQEQQSYYTDLLSMLKTNAETLKISIDEQLEADRVRELNLLMWERDLWKAEVLLQVDPDVTGNQKLLSMKMAQMDLDAIKRLSDKQLVDSRKATILKLYRELQSAVESLKKNNRIIVDYLGSNDKAFALRSLDVEGIFQTISAIRSLQEELGSIEKRSEQERQNENERIQKALERTRDVLIKVFKK